VIYMALKHIALISERLLSAGRRPDEPVAVVSRATVQGQRVLETDLLNVAAQVAEQDIEPPAIVVVGEVVRLRAALDWLGAIEGRQLLADPLGRSCHRQTGSE